MGTLKRYVRNRSKPEGSIAQGYVAEECLSFCTLYLADYVDSKFNKRARNEDVTESTSSTYSQGLDVFSRKGHDPKNGKTKIFDAETLKKAHQYVLFNCETVKPYIE